jgi:hypothetical protein
MGLSSGRQERDREPQKASRVKCRLVCRMMEGPSKYDILVRTVSTTVMYYKIFVYISDQQDDRTHATRCAARESDLISCGTHFD